MAEVIPVKLVIVGDGSIGKTCIMIRFTENYFKTEYVATVFENMTKQMQVLDRRISLSLWDTAGQEDYSRLRPIAYPNTDIFLVAFSVVEPDSFKNAKKKWIPEIRKEVPAANILFVGSKVDLRDSDAGNKNFLSRKDLEKHIGEEFKSRYVECSALTGQGIREVFDEAVKIVLAARGIIKPSVMTSYSKPEPSRQEDPNSGAAGYCSACQLI